MNSHSISRYLANGQLDPSYGIEGVFASGQLADFEIMPDQSVLLFEQRGLVQKLDPDGRLDPEFSETRIAFPSGGGNVPIREVERVGDSFYVFANSRVAVLKLDAQLRPDATFGVNGLTSFVQASGFSIYQLEDVTVAPDDVVYLATSVGLSDTPDGVGILAVMPDGSLDQRFGDRGAVVTSAMASNPSSIAVDSFSRVIVGGVSRDLTKVVFARFDPDGSPDTTFGAGGTTSFNFGTSLEAIRNVAVLADGSVVGVGLAGRIQPTGNSHYDGLVVKLDAFGNLDTDFASNGRLLFKLSAQNDFFSVRVDPEGRLVVGGSTYDLSLVSPGPSSAVLIRLTAPTPASLSHTLDNRTLTLQGGAGKDLFEVSQQGSSLRVRGAGQELFFDAAAIDSISIQTGDASDNLVVRGVTTPLSIDLGGGNDLIDTDGLAPMTIVGGAGRDSVIANGAGDIGLDAAGINLTHRISLASVERWFVNGSAGADVVEIHGMPPTSTEVLVDLSTGTDDVRITASALGTLAFAGAGNKRLTIDHLAEGDGHVYERVAGRIGFDGVTFDARLFGEVTIRAGSGDDTAIVQPALAPLVFEGGEGTDRLEFLNVGVVPPTRTSLGAAAGVFALNPFASVSFVSAESDAVLADTIAPEATAQIERTSRLAVIVETHEPIAAPAPDMIEVIDLATGQRLSTSAYSVLPLAGGAGFGFEVRFVPSQINGRYSVVVSSDALTDAAGNVADSLTVALNHLRADTNDDGAVSFDDVLTIVRNIGKTNATRAEGDLDYDGVVGFRDLLMIAQDFGRMLTVAPTTTSASVRARRDTALSLVE